MSKLFRSAEPRRTRAIAAALLASTILAGGGYAWSTMASAADTPPVAPPPAAISPAGTPVFAQAGFADLVAKVRPAVVNIATSEPGHRVGPMQMPNVPPNSPFGEMFRQFFGNQQMMTAPKQALGSGFIIDPAGYIVTNNHVVDGAKKITVTLENGDTFPATVKGRDTKTDLALLKIDAGRRLASVSFGNSSAERVGDWVIAVGNPFGLGGSVTAGIVSANGRNINEGPYDNFLQIDAPINPGNSGGPLFNQSGQVIGIDTAIYSPSGGSVGIGFAIPSDTAAAVITQLRENGKVERGWLGVQMQPITPALAKAIGRSDNEGVLVDKVVPDSPASHGDLHQGDVITAFNGTPIKSPRDLAMAVADTKAGSDAKVTVWRDGAEHTVDVSITSQSKEQEANANESSEQGPVGLALAPLTPDQRSALGLDDSTKGVVVTAVTPDSRAADSGLRPGDVIVRVGGETVTTPGAVEARIHAAEHEKKQAVPVLVMRDGTTYYLALQLAEG